MIKKLSIVFVLFFFSTTSYAQADLEEARVKEIRAMYGKSQEYLKSARNCRERKKIERKAAYDGGERTDYPQKVRRCDLPEGLSVITGEFSDLEFSETISFFQEHGDVYFVFIVSHEEGGSTELRVYFDLKGRLIRLLEKTDHETGRMSENVKITDRARIQSVYDYVKERLEQSRSILSQN
ncbi:MAG: hypothetical protein RL090_37 [Bacteroidota bacterium]|jgi:hypothetical protein